MRILIFAMGSAGDVHPFVGIGKALQARGHEVIIATGAYFEPVVRRAGLDFRPLGTLEDFERIQSHPHLWHPVKALPAIIRHAVDPGYETLLGIARELHLPGETVILASTLGWGTFAARELLKVPVVTVHLAPSLFFSVHRQPVLPGAPVPQGAPRFLKSLQWWAADRTVDRLVLPGLNRFRSSHGLPPMKHMTRHWHSPDRVIGLFPDWFAPPQPDWPEQARLTGFPLFDESGQREIPPDLATFLDAGEPPVVFTPGSAMDRGHEFFAEAVAALKLLRKRGILITRFPATVPSGLPESIRHFGYVPFSQVLPRAAAIVHHGGIGTCAQALQAGIPQLVMPMAHDQPDNLSRLLDLGCGCGLSPRRFEARRLVSVLGDLLENPAAKRAATEIASRFDPPAWIARTCDLVEDAAR